MRREAAKAAPRFSSTYTPGGRLECCLHVRGSQANQRSFDDTVSAVAEIRDCLRDATSRLAECEALLADAIELGDEELEARARELIAKAESDVHCFRDLLFTRVLRKRERQRQVAEMCRLKARLRTIDREIAACSRQTLIRCPRRECGRPRARARHRGHAPRRGPPREPDDPCDVARSGGVR